MYRKLFSLNLFLIISSAVFCMEHVDPKKLFPPGLPIDDIQRIILDYAYEWQARATIQCEDKIYSINYSIDGRYLIVGLDTRQIRIYEAATAKLVKELDYNDRGTAVTAICALPNNKFIVGIATNGTLLEYDMSNLPQISEKLIAKELGEIDIIERSSQNLVATASRKGKALRLWCFDNQKRLICINQLKKHKDTPYALAYSPDGNYIASGSYDKVIKISETKKFNTISMLMGHKSWLKGIIWPTNNRIISTDSAVEDKNKGEYVSELRIWDVSDLVQPKCIKILQKKESNNVLISFNNKYLIFDTYTDFCKPCLIQLYDLEADKYLEPLSGTSDIPILVSSPDGRYLACASERDDWQIEIWENPAAAILSAILAQKK